MTSEPGSLLKLKASCEGNQEKCSRSDCPLFGTLLPESRDGKQRIRNCGDPVARGKKNRRTGHAAQRKARKALGVASQKFSDAHEETWVDPLFRTEVKAGKQCGPLANWWARVRKQLDANEPDHGARQRYRRAVAMPDNERGDGLVVVELSTWEQVISPALDAYWGEAQ